MRHCQGKLDSSATPPEKKLVFFASKGIKYKEKVRHRQTFFTIIIKKTYKELEVTTQAFFFTNSVNFTKFNSCTLVVPHCNYYYMTTILWNPQTWSRKHLQYGWNRVLLLCATLLLPDEDIKTTRGRKRQRVTLVVCGNTTGMPIY